MERNWIACFFSVNHTEFDTIEKIFHEYDHGLYIIAAENTEKEKEHFHFLFEGSEQIYNNFSKRIVEKYNLRRKGRGGLIKYGKVKNIRNLERMMTYTLKDNTFRSNMDNKMIQSYFEKSFKKELKKELIDNIVEYIDEQEHWSAHKFTVLCCQTWQATRQQAMSHLIDYLVDNNIRHSKSALANWIYQFFIRSTKYTNYQKKQMLRHYHIFD